MNKIDISKGRYWSRAWSLVDGCSPCSPGCRHCWAQAMEHRFKKGDHLTYEGEWGPMEGRFNGRIQTRPDRLDIPLRTRKPTVFAVWNDLFHKAVPDSFIAQVYQAIYDTRYYHKKHTFLILTKRPERMLDVARRLEAGCLCSYMDGDESGAEWVSNSLSDVLPFVWHGLTVCNQEEADAKIPVFLQVPGKKFLSIEPVLSDIKIKGPSRCGSSGESVPQIDAVILGGETGPGARPVHPDWVRSVRDQCAAAGVPFFFKQWGEWRTATETANDNYEGHVYNKPQWHIWGDRVISHRVGRKFAGRILDGRTHDDLPWVK